MFLELFIEKSSIIEAKARPQLGLIERALRLSTCIKPATKINLNAFQETLWLPQMNARFLLNLIQKTS